MSNGLSYLEALQSSLPNGFAAGLATQGAETLQLLDRLVCFACGGPCPDGVPEETRTEWSVKQAAAKKALQNLVQAKTDGKRKRDDESDSAPDIKRARVSPLPVAEDKDDDPLYTLHAISVSSPVRKKVDITVHEKTLRFVHPSTTISIPRSSIKYAFLLPTRGKAKPHWTVVLLTDMTESAKATASSTQKAKTPEKTQIIFGIEAAPSTAFMTTIHSTSSSPSKETYQKNTPSLPVLRTFFKNLGVHAYEPSTSAFKSACPDTLNPGESGTPSLTACSGAKSGTLYFFDTGLLWGETKPFLWWPLDELAPMEEDEGSLRGGVRVVWAGGKLCTIVLSRGVEGGEGRQELDEGEETHLGMVDWKEKEGVEAWVKRHKKWFGKGKREARLVANGDVKGKGKEVAVNGDEGEDVGDSDDDEEDEDFEGDSDSDGGSPSEASSDEDGEAEGEAGEEQEGDDDEDAEGVSEPEDEEEVLDPARHPLMRPGAMPRMSKGVMDMVVGIVQEDFLGTGEDLADDEEDELDD